MLRRFLLLATALVFAPLGFYVVKSSFYLTSPHFFVMSIFSGSLMILLGLTGVVGLALSFEGKSFESKSFESKSFKGKSFEGKVGETRKSKAGGK